MLIGAPGATAADCEGGSAAGAESRGGGGSRGGVASGAMMLTGGIDLDEGKS